MKLNISNLDGIDSVSTAILSKDSWITLQDVTHSCVFPQAMKKCA